MNELDADAIPFSNALVVWYEEAQRKLPWRETKDPYAILVSELMLQQTQVKTVIPYYHRFLEQFPTTKALAQTEEETLLKAWQGLGYYRRARYLQAAARQIEDEHGGVFPDEKEKIDGLKGVGSYTSAAVASIAFNLPHAVVDGNVIRVVSRLSDYAEDVTKTASKGWIQDRAQAWLNQERPGDFNQAMMELGATICTPRKPCCMTCPVNQFCETFKKGNDPERLPIKAKRAAPSKAEYRCLFLFSEGKMLLAKRPEKGLMAGMWELPAQDKERFQPWPDLLDGAPEYLGDLKPVSHKFTHLHASYHISVYRSPLPIVWRTAPNAYAETRWIDLKAFEQLPLTKVMVKSLPLIMDFLKGEKTCLEHHSKLPGMPNTN